MSKINPNRFRYNVIKKFARKNNQVNPLSEQSNTIVVTSNTYSRENGQIIISNSDKEKYLKEELPKYLNLRFVIKR